MSNEKEEDDEDIMHMLKRLAAKKFQNGQVRGDAFARMLKILRVSKSSKSAIALFVTNLALFDAITVPAGCPILDQNVLAEMGQWRLVMFASDGDYLSSMASCPFTRNSNDIPEDEPEDVKYVSPMYMLAVEDLVMIGNDFTSGYINVHKTGDNFEFSQSAHDRFACGRGASRGGGHKSALLTTVSTVEEEPVNILKTIKDVWKFLKEELSLPYRFSNAGGGFNKTDKTEALMEFKYLTFRNKNNGNEWMGDGVLEGDTTENGGRPRRMRFTPVTDGMFDDGNVDLVSKENESSRKRRRKMTKEEKEKEYEDNLDAKLAALADDDLDLPEEGDDDDDDDDEQNNAEQEEETSEITKMMQKRAQKVQRDENTKARPSFEALPDWFRHLWMLEQDTKRTVEFDIGDATITATCRSELIIPGAGVKAINDLSSAGSVGSTYFVPLSEEQNNISILVVMSHSSPDMGVTSITIVAPFTKPE